MLMQAHTVLDSVAMAYVPLWSRARELAGVRLCVRAIHPEGVDAHHLLQAIGDDWPEGAPPLLLSLQTPRLLQQALACPPVRNTLLEVPASLFGAQETLARLSLARRNGHLLVRHGDWSALHGRPTPGVDHRNLFRLEPLDRIEPMPGQMVEGVDTQERLRQVLDQAQAAAVLGWPAVDVLRAHKRQPLHYDARVVRQVLQAIDDEECSVEYLERVVRQDPVLIYRILMLVNSAAYGLRREIGSLRHAIMMLGFRELGRWLTEQVPEAEPDIDLQPVRYAMVMRSRLAQHLLATGSDDLLRAEVYTTAALSQLDLLLHQPLADLLHRLPLAGRVTDAVLRHDGPYFPLLDIARAMGDPERLDRMETLCRRHELTLEQVNRALLRMLATSRDHAGRRSERLAH
ncbi:HDOD domain-containing protein [Hydrogenophaga sp. SNF1]|uniref:HDOD domain-containing protein n=1 Tax=Hydrogenophaga borbori TaxID=2294117 RepID=A0A372ELZ5_9BURK|nr:MULTISPECIES: HDOD domain-containing protein [Hydrogenophaga]RFP80407.1 HDOD domain-containing protein [Hydrogenophaga borbori]WQB84503.1 HDOD domain-containing protein [Hydrogenophaga sp. SNF1]